MRYRSIRRLLWNYDYGIDSGIPKCCIFFYIFRELLGSLSDLLRHKHRFRYQIYTGTVMNIEMMIRKKEWDYVPCPLCLVRGRRVKVIKCKEPYKFPEDVWKRKKR